MSELREDDVIELNVGGTHYTCIRSTLTRYPDSLLGRLFGESGPAPVRDSHSRYVLDRDGPVFRYVLAFLRNQQPLLPSVPSEVEMLRVEADHYQLSSLLQALAKSQDLHRTINVLVQPTHITVSGKVDVPVLAEIKRSWSLLNQGQSIHDPSYLLYECSKERGAHQLAPYCTLQMEKKQPNSNNVKLITHNDREWLEDLLRSKGWRELTRTLTSINGVLASQITFDKRLPMSLK